MDLALEPGHAGLLGVHRLRLDVEVCHGWRGREGGGLSAITSQRSLWPGCSHHTCIFIDVTRKIPPPPPPSFILSFTVSVNYLQGWKIASHCYLHEHEMKKTPVTGDKGGGVMEFSRESVKEEKD